MTPDYGGGGIVNLMSSIIRARGGRSNEPPLRDIPTEELSEVTHLILLVIDGLGARWLAEASPGGILTESLRTTLTSVFPSTTATAIPTFLTGLAPLQHGSTGWHTFLGELGTVMTVLPGVPRCGGVSYRQAGIDPARLFGTTPIANRIATPSYLVAPSRIARSDFNQAHLGRGRSIGYTGLRAMFRRTAAVIGGWRRRRRERSYLYLYWPTLDAIGHQQGMGSPAAVAHLLEIERAIEAFREEVAGTDTRVLVCADHGQLDTEASDVIDLADHPTLASCLLLPLCGEPRAAFAYLRDGQRETFVRYCRERLSEQIDVVPSAELREQGLFGFGPAHPRFSERIGDWCLLPRGSGVIRQWLPFEKPFHQVGVHGGLSEAELLVPLCVIDA